MRKENEQTAKDYQSKITKQAKDFAITNALKDAGAKNTKAVLALLDLDKVSVDEDGQLFGIAEQLEELQKTDAYLFTPKQIKLEKKALSTCLLVVILVLTWLRIPRICH